MKGEIGISCMHLKGINDVFEHRQKKEGILTYLIQTIEMLELKFWTSQRLKDSFPGLSLIDLHQFLREPIGKGHSI